MNFPVFETNRLRLDKLTHDDSFAVFELFSTAKVIQYYDLEAFKDVSQAEELIDLFQSRFEAKTGIRWAIRQKDTKHLLGTCGFNSWNPKMRHAVVGYDLLPKYWGAGFATEALRRVVEAAFNAELSCGALNRIQADTVLGNQASESLLLKVGFKEEGVRRQSGFWKGQFHDLKCFGLILSEYKREVLED